jgi:hypothetical protein
MMDRNGRAMQQLARAMISAALLGIIVAGCAASPQQLAELKRHNDARDAQMLAGNRDQR